MPHVMLGGPVRRPAAELARRLTALPPEPLRRAFSSESGSVAVEVAMKMAVRYRRNRGEAGRTRFASFAGAVPEKVLLPLTDTVSARRTLERTLEARRGEIAAVLVEPLIPGAVGMRMHDAWVLRTVADAARANGIPVIADEIFSGFGRTGTMFAFEQAGFVPDLVAVSKALTGGTLPLAATVASVEIFSAFWSDDSDAAPMHGPPCTFPQWRR